MKTWTASHPPDVSELAAIAAENEVARRYREEVVSNHVLSFTTEIRSLLAHALDRNRKIRLYVFDGARFERNLAPLRAVLDDFYNGKITLDEAELVLRPIVVESLHEMDIGNTFFFARNALKSIEKIKI